jgi:hypothetical protein
MADNRVAKKSVNTPKDTISEDTKPDHVQTLPINHPTTASIKTKHKKTWLKF